MLAVNIIDISDSESGAKLRILFYIEI